MSKQGCHNMTARQMELLLMQCMFRITPEQRNYLMRECSDAYNAWCGGEVVKVVRVSDGVDVADLMCATRSESTTTGGVWK